MASIFSFLGLVWWGWDFVCHWVKQFDVCFFSYWQHAQSAYSGIFGYWGGHLEVFPSRATCVTHQFPPPCKISPH